MLSSPRQYWRAASREEGAGEGADRAQTTPAISVLGAHLGQGETTGRLDVPSLARWPAEGTPGSPEWEWGPRTVQTRRKAGPWLKRSK